MLEQGHPQGEGLPVEEALPETPKNPIDAVFDAAVCEVEFCEGSVETKRGIRWMMESEETNVNGILEKRGRQIAMLQDAIAVLRAMQEDASSGMDPYKVGEAVAALENRLRPIQSRQEEMVAKYDLDPDIAELRMDVGRICGAEDFEISKQEAALKELLRRIRGKRVALASTALLAEEQSRVERALSEIIVAVKEMENSRKDS